MSHQVKIGSGAVKDYQTIYREFETARMGLGEEFRLLFRKYVGQIREYPASCPVVYRGTHRLLLGKFPYHLYYRIRGTTVIVVAILPARQDPQASRRRLREERGRPF